MNALDLIQSKVKGWAGIQCTHYICYNGDVHVHRGIPYSPNDPKIITKQLEMMLDDGITEVIGTWQGAYATACNQNAITLASLCQQMGLKFMFLLDPWCAKLNAKGVTVPSTQNVVDSLSAASTQKILNASNYDDQRLILDFNTGADLKVLAQKFSGITFGKQGTDFSWISIPSITDSVARNVVAVNDIKAQHSNSLMKVASYWSSFDDSGMPLPQGVQSQAAFDAAGGKRDYAQSVWSPNPVAARILESFSGELETQILQTITPVTRKVARGTWNDYDEQSSGPREKVLAEEQGIDWSQL
jgi:hypothetical protein